MMRDRQSGFMKRLGAVTILLATWCGPGRATADDNLTLVEPPRLVQDAKTKSWHVTFKLSRRADVEVAIIDPKTGSVVRHLAAGVLGDNAPPPLAAYSAAQQIPWDGKDDYRQGVAEPSKLSVRLRAGMSVALKNIAGGNPYGYYSPEMPHGDHSPWGINGLELKSDGKVYVWGHSSSLGPPALRQYDIDGNYLQTLFPPPAGKPVEAMKGWGINVKADGTYAPKFNRLTDPSLGSTILDRATGGMARLFPSPDPAHLTFWAGALDDNHLDLLTINNDGTIAATANEQLHGPIVASPPLGLGPVEPNSHHRHSLIGPVFTCFAPDGTHFYLSGVCRATTRYGSVLELDKKGAWRDGQVWKVDLATRTAKVFFALDEAAVAAAGRDRKSPIGGIFSHTALHGVAVDRDGRVFVCDRLNQRVVVLDDGGKTLREIPVSHADAVAISSRTGALYVTTRTGDERNGSGEVRLLKFASWRQGGEPVEDVPLCETHFTNHYKHSYVVLCEKKDATNVWVAYTEMPVRIYQDDAKGLTLLKDFLQVDGAQRCMGLDRIDVDRKTGEVYVLDDHVGVWKIGDWEHRTFEKTPLFTASIGIDSRRRHIYIRTLADGSSSYSVGKVARYHLDQPEYPPANFGATGTNRLTPAFHHEWCFTGNGDKGFAIAPNGNVAVVGDPKDGLRLFHGDESKVPWDAIKLRDLPHMAGGIRFDLSGNLYVGIVDKAPAPAPAGLEGDPLAAKMGRIHKYAPTGNLDSGNLFPKPPPGPVKSYDVSFGAFDVDCIIRTPRFDVDGFGRIYYPTNVAQRVVVMDNAGNEIVAFGTYGNRDSLGGLPGDLVPTPDIPLAFPNSVAATDRYIYVGDMANVRLLQIEKRFALDVTSK